VVLLLIILVLAIALSVSLIVRAEKSPSLPHDGGCVAYCARARLSVWNGEEWVAPDLNGDGKVQFCHKEIRGFLGPDGEPVYEDQCHKAVDPNTGEPICPEFEGRCILIEDYEAFGGSVPGPNPGDVACVLQ
jgi:hypothetical protein